MKKTGDYKQAIEKIRVHSLFVAINYFKIKSICREFKITNSLATTLVKVGAMVKTGTNYMWKDMHANIDKIAEDCKEYNRVNHKHKIYPRPTVKSKQTINLNEATCINFLKSTGKYKIQTLTQTWTEI